MRHYLAGSHLAATAQMPSYIVLPAVSGASRALDIGVPSRERYRRHLLQDPVPAPRQPGNDK
jgi:hypothetical protein